MPNRRILSHAIAQQFLKDPQSVALNECDVLEDHAAAILASSREDLCLDGLKAISAAAAQALIHHTGAISLQSLEELTLSTAQFLSQHVGPLRELNLGAFIDEPFVFAALRRHPSLVAQVVQDDLMARANLATGGPKCACETAEAAVALAWKWAVHPASADAPEPRLELRHLDGPGGRRAGIPDADDRGRVHAGMPGDRPFEKARQRRCLWSG